MPIPKFEIHHELKGTPLGNAFPMLVDNALGWMKKHYPDVDFEWVRYYRLERTGRDLIGMNGMVAAYAHYRRELWVCDSPLNSFYAMAHSAIPQLQYGVLWPDSWFRNNKCSLEDGLTDEAAEKVVICRLVHELTHCVQYLRKIHRGNEVDTALNELAWLYENAPTAYVPLLYDEFTEGEDMPVIKPAIIRRRRRGEPLPSYLKHAGRNYNPVPKEISAAAKRAGVEL